MSNTLEVTMVHELFHRKDAKEYREKIGDINQQTSMEYFKYRDDFALNKIKKHAEKYDFERISAYACKSVGVKKYDEVYTELRTFLLQGGQYVSIVR